MQQCQQYQQCQQANNVTYPNNVNNVNNVNNINCSVKSATLAHHLGPIFGLVLIITDISTKKISDNNEYFRRIFFFSFSQKIVYLCTHQMGVKVRCGHFSAIDKNKRKITSRESPYMRFLVLVIQVWFIRLQKGCLLILILVQQNVAYININNPQASLLM